VPTIRKWLSNLICRDVMVSMGKFAMAIIFTLYLAIYTPKNIGPHGGLIAMVVDICINA